MTIAVGTRHLDILELVAPKSGNYNGADPYKVDALVEAAEDDQIAMVEVLAENSDQFTIEEALMSLSSGGNVVVMKLLLEKTESDSRKHVFTKAVEKGLIKLALMLLDEMDTSSVRWALMIAASNG